MMCLCPGLSVTSHARTLSLWCRAHHLGGQAWTYSTLSTTLIQQSIHNVSSPHLLLFVTPCLQSCNPACIKSFFHLSAYKRVPCLRAPTSKALYSVYPSLLSPTHSHPNDLLLPLLGGRDQDSASLSSDGISSSSSFCSSCHRVGQDACIKYTVG